MVGGRPKFLPPIGDERHAAEMTAQGMAADIEPFRIATETRRVPIGPGDGAAHLLGHDAQIAVRRADRNEIQHDVMRAGIDQHFGRIGIVLGLAAEPGAAMDEDEEKIGAFGRLVL